MTELVALTGGSGFIGRALAARLLERGWRVRALVRRPDAALESAGVELLQGALEDEASLPRLLAGATAVVHCAGAVRARRPADFETVNALGTARLAAAAAACATPPRFLLLSSLAAREPRLSPYARSKHQSEEALARAGGLDHLSLRPPAVYGPGDRATLALFRQLAKGIAVLPAPRSNRFSLIYINDLVESIAHLLEQKSWPGGHLELDDGHPQGYAWADLAAIAETALERPVRTVSIPAALLWAAASANEALSPLLGRAPILTRGKMREFLHPDWLCKPSESAALAGWQAKVDLNQGLPSTFLWYKERGWI